MGNVNQTKKNKDKPRIHMSIKEENIRVGIMVFNSSDRFKVF